MQTVKQRIIAGLSAAALFVGYSASSAFGATADGRPAPIRLHPSNPHYFEFRGHPAILVTSAEHYGAVINRDFDWLRRIMRTPT